MKNFAFSKTILSFILAEIILLSPMISYGMYNGSPNWHPPKKLICNGIPTFPQGIKIITYSDQVFGRSLDSYVFCQLEGAIGIYYFTLGLQEPKNSNILTGEAIHLNSSDWQRTEFKVKCTVSEWHWSLE